MNLLLLAMVSGLALEMPIWLAGDWCRIDDEGRLEERWLTPTDNLMLATNRMIVGSRTVAFEFLRIERNDHGAVSYIAQPGGRGPTYFTMTEHDADHARFENPDHDFPQVIDYRLDSGSLRATASGPDGELLFVFSPCPDG
jgi:hypothetical protein